MKRENGFSLIELMVAMTILLIITAAAIGLLSQAQQVTQGIGLQANMQEDLRAGMHFIVRDLTQAGEGIPAGGIMLPYNTTGATPTPASIVWPGAALSPPDFPAAYTALTPIIPGYQSGQKATGVNPLTGAVISTGADKSDIITILYADNTLVDANGHTLNQFAVNQTAGTGLDDQTCGGTIDSAGASVTLDKNCFTIPTSQPTLWANGGDLILFTSAAGTALEYVTSVNGQTINFAGPGTDPAGLNGLSAATYPDGTVAKLYAASAGANITITRVWMITYYEDSTSNPLRPQLVRQVNYPGYPTVATATYPPQPIGEAIENLQFTYDIIDSTAPTTPTPTYPNGPGDATQPNLTYDSPLQIRAVNISLYGRSEYPFTSQGSSQYLHNNLSTQVCIRNMSFVNQFNTSPDATTVTAPGP